MSARVKSLLVIKTEKVLSRDQRQAVTEAMGLLAERLGMAAAVLDGGLDAGIHSDLRPLMEEQIREQQQTNKLLMMLIEALGEEEADPDAEPTTYMDGSPVGYQPSHGRLCDPPGGE